MFLSSARCDPPDCNLWSNKTGFWLICQHQPRALDIICWATPSAQALPVALGRIPYCYCTLAGPVLNVCKISVGSGFWVLQRGLLAGNLKVGARSRTGIGNMPGWGGDAAIGTPVPWLRPSSGSVPPISSVVSFRGVQRATLATQEQERNKLPHPDLCNGLCKSIGMD